MRQIHITAKKTDVVLTWIYSYIHSNYLSGAQLTNKFNVPSFDFLSPSPTEQDKDTDYCKGQ